MRDRPCASVTRLSGRSNANRDPLLPEWDCAQVRATSARSGNCRDISQAGLTLRMVFDMSAQFGDRAEPDRPLRQLRLDRSIRVKRVGHAIDDAGFEDSNLWL